MNLKEKLRKDRVTLGSWITLGSYPAAEVMVKCGFDWLAIDMEHSVIELEQAQDLIRIIESYGCVPLVRVSQNCPNLIKRVMDAGAHGVIVPMINSEDDCERAVRAVKYPPLGTRGVGLGRAQLYGLSFKEYKNWVNKNSILIVQIEHIDAVDNLDKILAVKGIDGFIVGPYDLSASLGRPGDFNAPEFLKAMSRIKSIASNHKIASGFHVIPPDAKEVNKKIKEGYTFVGFSLDALFLGKKCLEEIKQVKKSA